MATHQFQKNAGRTGGKLKPQDTESTGLQELTLLNSTYFGTIQCDIHSDLKLDDTISRNFQEISVSELETLHKLCELGRTQILQSLAVAVLKISYGGYLLPGKILWFILAPKTYHLYVFLKIKYVIK